MKSKADKTAQSQWVLLRGLAREARHWGELPAVIERRVAASEVITLDLPGTGRYSEMKSPLTIGEIAAFVREKLAELRESRIENGCAPARETHLVAVSLGGMVAAEWLSRWPDEFTSCVLINTSFRGFSPIHHRLAPGSYRHLLSALLSKDVRVREQHVLQMVSNRPEIHDEIAEAWEKIQLSRPVSLENFMRQLIAAARFQPKLGVPPIPVMILNSLEDKMVKPSCSRMIADKWNAELRCHPSAGHDLALDAPDWIVDQILDWQGRVKGLPIEKRAHVSDLGS